ncbi:MAG TPA: ComEC/Rec2 family competence protein [Candidatus Saccharimonadales bacterium]|nr:ComEC/Rec2 family competence protein [Candidatus Saccharimonadales bacterium]
MTRPGVVVRLPALPAALAAAGVATAATIGLVSPPVIAVVLTTLTAILALCSTDRLRRLAWSAAAVAAVATAAGLVVGPLTGWLPSVADPTDLRMALSGPLRRLVPEPESGILVGIALGERTAIGPDLAHAFAASGTTHLLAISGFNMTLVAAAAGLAVRGRGRPVTRAAVMAAAVLGYSVLVSGGASVFRAALMAQVAALGLAVGRRAAAGNALAAAVAMMLIADPATIADAGFLLSVGATAGLFAFQERIAAHLGALPTVIREGLAATLAATIPTLPIVAAIFGRISLIAPLANVLAVPLFPPLMLSAVATSVIGVFAPLAAWPFALCGYVLARVLRAVVETAAALPVASVEVPRGPLTALLLGLGCMVSIRIVPALKGRLPPVMALRHWRPAIGVVGGAGAAGRRTQRTLGAGRSLSGSGHVRSVALALVGCLVVAAVALTLLRPGPVLRVLALDIGQGDAYLIEVDGHRALIDGGPDPGRLLQELGASLPPWDRRIDVVALTHAHTDHGAGLLPVLDRFRVGLAIEPLGLGAGPLASAWTQHAAAAGVPRRAATAGATVRLGSATLRFLAPEPDVPVDVPSLVVRLESGSFTMLFMGDATEAAQAALLRSAGALRSRVYVPPHHGAASPHGAALVAAVGPEVAVISAGRDNAYGHPTPQTLEALGRIPTFRTDRDGTVELTVTVRGVAVRAHANALAPPRQVGPRGLQRG